MAENFIKRALNTLYTKSVTEVPQNVLYGDKLNVFETYFDWILGKGGEFSKYTKSYGENPLVYMVVNKIAFNSASIKRIAVNENGDEILNSKLLSILATPNEDDDEIEFRQKINEYLLLTGNAFIKIIKGEGMGVQLTVLHTPDVEIKINKIGDIVRYKYVLIDGTTVYYEVDDILHIKTSNVVNVRNSQVKYGLSPLQSAWIVVTSSMEKLKADASIFKSRGIIGILTSDSDTPMLDPERQRLQKSFDKDTSGADKFNKIHITSSRLKFLQTGMSPTDLRLLEGILSSLRLICGVFGMPSVLFNDNDSSTYNNISEAKITAFTDVYIPLAIKVDKELSKWLSNLLNISESLLIDKKSIEVLKSSTNEVAQSLSRIPTNVAQRAVETMTKDEVREHILGMDSLGTGGDELIGQANNTQSNDKESK
jgi:HK97 family phage portal protein